MIGTIYVYVTSATAQRIAKFQKATKPGKL